MWAISTEQGWPEAYGAEYIALTRLHGVALVAGSDVIRPSTLSRSFARLVSDARLPDLSPRPFHTCASLLIAQGAHPKAAQVHLGHSSISVTMDRYGHLFPSNMQALAAALDGMRAQALADHTRTKGEFQVLELTAR